MAESLNKAIDIFDIFDYEDFSQEYNFFSIKIILLKHGWLDIVLKLIDNTNVYRPNTYCYPLEYMMDSAIFSLVNKDNIGSEFEFKHDAEQDGYCFWNLKIIENEKLKLLIRLNPDLQLQEEVTELGSQFLKYYKKEIELLKEDIRIAIEIDCLEFAKVILKSIDDLINSVNLSAYKKAANADFPELLLKELKTHLKRI